MLQGDLPIKSRVSTESKTTGESSLNTSLNGPMVRIQLQRLQQNLFGGNNDKEQSLKAKIINLHQRLQMRLLHFFHLFFQFLLKYLAVHVCANSELASRQAIASRQARSRSNEVYLFWLSKYTSAIFLEGIVNFCHCFYYNG